MNKIKYSSHNLTDGSVNLELSISGKDKENRELVIESINLLISQLEPKFMYDQDTEKYDQDLEDLLLSVVDKIGNDFIYYNLFESDIHYDEDNDEMIVPMEVKIKVLSMLVESMKHKYL